MTAQLKTKERFELIRRAKRGEKISTLCSEAGISRTIFYRWQSRYNKTNKYYSLAPKLHAPKEWNRFPKLTPRLRLQMVVRARDGESVKVSENESWVEFMLGDDSENIRYDQGSGQYTVNLYTKNYDWIIPGKTYQVKVSNSLWDLGTIEFTTFEGGKAQGKK